MAERVLYIPIVGQLGAMVHTFTGLRAEILGLFGELEDAAQARGAAATARSLAAGRQRLLDERLVVVVCGEFKRGKSTLLNALLEEPDLFPVDSFYATGLITEAGYGADESIRVSVGAADGDLRHIRIRRNEIADYATESGNPDNVKQVQLVTIRIPNPRLAEGLTFVDTPGVGSIYERHSAVTLGYLQSASALVFVADATQPLLESELGFVRRAAETARITDDVDGVVFALTKIDAVADFEGILANTKAKLAEVMNRRPDAIEVVPVSARAKLDYLRSRSAEYLELSNFDALERVLSAALARRRARALLGAALADLDRGARALLAPIEAEMRILSCGDEQLAAQIEDRLARIAELRDNRDRWHSELADQLSQAIRQFQGRGQQELDEVWHTCETGYLNDGNYLAAPDLLLDQVMADAAGAFGAISKLAGRAAARTLQDFSARHGLELRRPEFGRLPAPPVPLTRLSADLASADRPVVGLSGFTRAASGSVSGRIASSGVGMAIGATVGSVLPGLGTLVGMHVGWVAGFVFGSSAGAVAGYRDAVKEAKGKGVQLRREQLWTKLQPVRRAQHSHLADGLENLMADYKTAAERELESRIAQEQESVAATLARLKARRNQSEHAAEARRAELAADRTPLDRMLDRIGSLGLATAALNAMAPSRQNGAG